MVRANKTRKFLYGRIAELFLTSMAGLLCRRRRQRAEGARRAGTMRAAPAECRQFHKSPPSERYAVITVKANKFVCEGGDKTKSLLFRISTRFIRRNSTTSIFVTLFALFRFRISKSRLYLMALSLSILFKEKNRFTVS